MYQDGKRIISHHKRHVVLVWFVIIILLAGAGCYIFVKYFMKSDTSISAPPAPAVSHVIAGDEKTKKFDEGSFTINLPLDWKFISHQSAVYNIYTWHNTKKNPGVEQLQVYVDTIPSDLGVNRVLPVQGSGNQIVATTVSDNCANFTGDKVPGSTRTPAKWANVNFLCDLGNYVRDVVGTSSSDGVNVVKLTGPTTGTHALFFAYTDNGPTPDFTIFTDAVQSFRLK